MEERRQRLHHEKRVPGCLEYCNVGDTVDGSEILRENHLRLVVYQFIPIILRFFIHPNGGDALGFLNHQQYHGNPQPLTLGVVSPIFLGLKTFILLCFGVQRYILSSYVGITTNQLAVSMIFYYLSLLGEDEPVLTSIFFTWVGSTHQPANHEIRIPYSNNQYLNGKSQGPRFFFRGFTRGLSS